MDDIIAELERLGAPSNIVSEVRNGYMRQADYTRKTQEAAALREQAAFALGQARGGGAVGGTKPVRKVEQYLAKFDGEEMAGVREILSGMAEAMREDMAMEQQTTLAPVVRGVQSLGWEKELDRRLESELIPRFGEGIRGEWSSLRNQMLEALGRDEQVDPTSFVFRALPDKAPQFISERMAQESKTKADGSQEGFARLSSVHPGMSPRGALGGNAPAAEGNGHRPVPPSVLDLQSRFEAVAAQVASGASA